MKTRKFALCLAAVFLVMIYINIQRNHTFTLSDDEGTIKTEQIQPLWGTVKVSGDCDTEVVFTDVETGEKYRIGGRRDHIQNHLLRRSGFHTGTSRYEFRSRDDLYRIICSQGDRSMGIVDDASRRNTCLLAMLQDGKYEGSSAACRETQHEIQL